MDKIKIDKICLADIKPCWQREADRLLATGEYITALAIANQYGMSCMTARKKMGKPDKACGNKIFLYSRKRVEGVLGRFEAQKVESKI